MRPVSVGTRSSPDPDRWVDSCSQASYAGCVWLETVCMPVPSPSSHGTSVSSAALGGGRQGRPF